MLPHTRSADPCGNVRGAAPTPIGDASRRCRGLPGAFLGESS